MGLIVRDLEAIWLQFCWAFCDLKFQKNPRAHKNKIGLPSPPPNPKSPPPKPRNFMDMGFSCRKNACFRGVHKIDAPISGPRITDKNFTDTKRIFLKIVAIARLQFGIQRPAWQHDLSLSCLHIPWGVCCGACQIWRQRREKPFDHGSTAFQNKAHTFWSLGSCALKQLCLDKVVLCIITHKMITEPNFTMFQLFSVIPVSRLPNRIVSGIVGNSSEQ